MKVEVAVLGSPTLISLMVSVDVKQHLNEKDKLGHLSLNSASPVNETQLKKTEYKIKGVIFLYLFFNLCF